MDKKIDITSTAVEKGLDMAKDFLAKLIMPAVEEAGLLIKDQVTMWRFNNQIRILNKTKSYCEKYNIAPKTISLKLLCPLLDYSGLEEDEELQNKWSILLGNMVDSEQNIENHVFPYILSQISKHEYDLVEKTAGNKKVRIAKQMNDIECLLNDKVAIEDELKQATIELEVKEEAVENEGDYKIYRWGENQDLKEKKWELQDQLNNLTYKIGSNRHSITQPEKISEKELQEFEISNLTRLGLVKEVRELLANSHTLEIPNDHEKSYLVVDFDVEVGSDDSFVLTELGELFIQACTDKNFE